MSPNWMIVLLRLGRWVERPMSRGYLLLEAVDVSASYSKISTGNEIYE